MTDEQKSLAEKYHNLIYYVMNKYNISIDDYDLLALGLCKAAINYNESRGAFSTFAVACMLREIQQEVRKEYAIKRIRKNGIIESLEKPISDTLVLGDIIRDEENHVSYMEALECLSLVISKLDDRSRKIVNLRLFENETLKAIGKMVGLSQAQVSRIYSKFIKSFKEEYYG